MALHSLTGAMHLLGLESIRRLLSWGDRYEESKQDFLFRNDLGFLVDAVADTDQLLEEEDDVDADNSGNVALPFGRLLDMVSETQVHADGEPDYDEAEREVVRLRALFHLHAQERLHAIESPAADYEDSPLQPPTPSSVDEESDYSPRQHMTTETAAAPQKDSCLSLEQQLDEMITEIRQEEESRAVADRRRQVHWSLDEYSGQSGSDSYSDDGAEPDPLDAIGKLHTERLWGEEVQRLKNELSHYRQSTVKKTVSLIRTHISTQREVVQLRQQLADAKAAAERMKTDHDTQTITAAEMLSRAKLDREANMRLIANLKRQIASSDRPPITTSPSRAPLQTFEPASLQPILQGRCYLCDPSSPADADCEEEDGGATLWNICVHPSCLYQRSAFPTAASRRRLTRLWEAEQHIIRLTTLLDTQRSPSHSTSSSTSTSPKQPHSSVCDEFPSAIPTLSRSSSRGSCGELTVAVPPSLSRSSSLSSVPPQLSPSHRLTCLEFATLPSTEPLLPLTATAPGPPSPSSPSRSSLFPLARSPYVAPPEVPSRDDVDSPPGTGWDAASLSDAMAEWTQIIKRSRSMPTPSTKPSPEDAQKTTDALARLAVRAGMHAVEVARATQNSCHNADDDVGGDNNHHDTLHQSLPGSLPDPVTDFSTPSSDQTALEASSTVMDQSGSDQTLVQLDDPGPPPASPPPQGPTSTPIVDMADVDPDIVEHAVSAGCTVIGTVKSFNPVKGYGFITVLEEMSCFSSTVAMIAAGREAFGDPYHHIKGTATTLTIPDVDSPEVFVHHSAIETPRGGCTSLNNGAVVALSVLPPTAGEIQQFAHYDMAADRTQTQIVIQLYPPLYNPEKRNGQRASKCVRCGTRHY